MTNCNKEEKKFEEKIEVASIETEKDTLNAIVIENKKIKFSDESLKLLKKFANNKIEVIENELKSQNYSTTESKLFERKADSIPLRT